MSMGEWNELIQINLTDIRGPGRLIRLEILIDRLHCNIDDVIFNSNQQTSDAPRMLSSSSAIQNYSSDYCTQVNTSHRIQSAAAITQPQHIMIPSASCTGGSATPGLSPLHYTGFYPDPAMNSLYSSASVNPTSVNPNWQLAWPYPQQQQQPTDQQGGYSNEQNIASQQASSTYASNNGGRSASTLGQLGAGNGGSAPPLALQYTVNDPISTNYTYGTRDGWFPGSQQVPSSQQIPPQQSTYVHPNAYETFAYFPQQSQQQPPPPQ